MRGSMATRLSTVLALVCSLAVASRACQIHDRTGRSLLKDDKVQFNYAKSGEDWPDVMCKFGKEQSPINVDLAATPGFENKKLHVKIGTFGKGKNVRSFSTGQGLQVVWDWVEQPDLQVPVLGPEHTSVLNDYSANTTVKYVKAEPIQFHFHTPSENTIDGRFFPLEAHIVCLISKQELPSCGDAGCIVVFGIHYEFALERNTFFDMIFAAAPRRTGAEFAGSIDPEYVLNLDLLVPTKRDYVMWKGSLTTPPCKEGVLWILFVEFEQITVEELFSLQNHMRDVKTACMEQALQESNVNGLKEKVSACDFIGDRTNNRPIQPINRRAIKKGYMDDAL